MAKRRQKNVKSDRRGFINDKKTEEDRNDPLPPKIGQAVS